MNCMLGAGGGGGGQGLVCQYMGLRYGGLGCGGGV